MTESTPGAHQAFDHPLYSDDDARAAGQAAHGDGLIAASKAHDAGAAVVRHYLTHADAPNRTAAELKRSADRVARAEDAAERMRAMVDRGDGPTIDDDGGLVRALAAAQAAFPPINKGRTATVAGRDGKAGYSYSYADIADVLAAVRPVLAEEGLAITQATRYLDDGRLMLETVLRHRGGGNLSSIVQLAQNPGDAQRFGGALTYLRRYELCTLLGIAAEDDTDAQHVPPAGQRDAPAQAPRAELPSWARPASVDAKRGMLDALEPLLGRSEAESLGKAIAGELGSVPYVVARFAVELRGIMDRLAEDANAPAARTAQDDAATAPDAPAPDPAPQPAPAPEAPADEVPPPAGTTDPAGPGPQRMVVRGADATDAHHQWARQQNDATLEDAAATLESRRGIVDPGYVAAARKERQRRRGPDATPPGSVQVDTSQAESATEAAATLKAHGCICDQVDAVFAGQVDPNPMCPIADHGTRVA